MLKENSRSEDRDGTIRDGNAKASFKNRNRNEIDEQHCQTAVRFECEAETVTFEREGSQILKENSRSKARDGTIRDGSAKASFQKSMPEDKHGVQNSSLSPWPKIHDPPEALLRMRHWWVSQRFH